MPDPESSSQRVRRRAWAWVRTEWAKEATAAGVTAIVSGIFGHNLGPTMLVVGAGLATLAVVFFAFAWCRAALGEIADERARTDVAKDMAEERRRVGSRTHNEHEETKAALDRMTFDRDQWKKNSAMMEENFDRVAKELQSERAKMGDFEKRMDALTARVASRVQVAKQRMSDHALRVAKLAKATTTNDSDSTLLYLEGVVEDVRTILGDFEADEIVRPMTTKVGFMQGSADGKPFISLLTRELKPLSDWLRMRVKDLGDDDLRQGFVDFQRPPA